MNLTVCTQEMSESAKLVLLFSVCVITVTSSFLGVFLNSAIVFVQIKHGAAMLRNWSDWLTLNIAVTDCLGVLFNDYYVIDYSTRYWCDSLSSENELSVDAVTFSTVFVETRNFLGVMGTTCMTLLSVQRFVYIVAAPDSAARQKLSRRQTLLRLSAVYAVNAAYIGTHFVSVQPIYHNLLSALYGNLLPLSVMWLAYGSVALKLWRSQCGESTGAVILQRRKCAVCLTIFLIFMTLCFSPYIIYAVLESCLPSVDVSIPPNAFGFVNFAVFWLENIAPRVSNAFLLFLLSSKLKRHLPNWNNYRVASRCCK